MVSTNVHVVSMNVHVVSTNVYVVYVYVLSNFDLEVNYFEAVGFFLSA